MDEAAVSSTRGRYQPKQSDYEFSSEINQAHPVDDLLPLVVAGDLSPVFGVSKVQLAPFQVAQHGVQPVALVLVDWARNSALGSEVVELFGR